MSEVDVIISEVGPRDGLQNLDTVMSTAHKIHWISALSEAGLPEIEVGSFVSPRKLPQMADTGDVVRHYSNAAKFNLLALIPNLRGAQDAVASGCRSLTMPISASDAHSQANIGMSPREAVEQLRKVSDFLAGSGTTTSLEVGMSTAFGCAVQGAVSEDWVIELALLCIEAGADSVGLSDTAGVGNPAQVKRLFTRLKYELGPRVGGAHLHNTRGQGLANVVAALEAGVTTFDSSQAGLGGCPFAPGASGNVVTEDLVYMLESMGLRTGVDIDKLLDARAFLGSALPNESLYGHVADAGVHRGFTYAGTEVSA